MNIEFGIDRDSIRRTIARRVAKTAMAHTDAYKFVVFFVFDGVASLIHVRRGEHLPFFRLHNLKHFQMPKGDLGFHNTAVILELRDSERFMNWYCENAPFIAIDWDDRNE